MLSNRPVQNVVAEISPEELVRHIENMKTRPSSLPVETAKWLKEGADLYDLHDGNISFDRCLGLCGKPGDRSWRTRYRHAMRREILAELRRELVGVHEVSDYNAAILLQNEVIGFNRDVWPQWKNLESPPPGANQFATWLFRAAKLGGRSLPESWQALHAASKEPAAGN